MKLQMNNRVATGCHIALSPALGVIEFSTTEIAFKTTTNQMVHFDAGNQRLNSIPLRNKTTTTVITRNKACRKATIRMGGGKTPGKTPPIA